MKGSHSIFNRILLILLFIGLTVMAYAGGQAEKEEKSKEDVTTISIFSHRLSETPYGDILRDQLAKYQELNPNIKIETSTAPFSEASTKFSSMVIGGSPPDAVFCARFSGQWLAQGLLMNLEPFLTTEDKAKFPVTAEGSVSDPETGNWYALPAEIQFWTLVINDDRAEAQDIEIPEDRQWTWDQFLRVSDKLTNPKRKSYAYTNYGYGSAAGQAIVVGHWMLANGGTYWGISPNCDEVNLLTEENIEAVKHYLKMGLEGYQPPGYIERGGGDHYRLLSSQAAMAVTHPGGVSNAISLSEGEISGFTPMFLPGTQKKVSLFTEAWGIPSGAERPKEGMKLIRWLNKDENAIERLKVQGTLPASLSALQQVKEVKPELSFWVDLVENSESACYEYLPRAGEIKQIATDGLTRMYTGEDVEKVLAETEEKIQKIISE